MSTPNPATTPWVPLWNLNGAAGMNYRGAYAGATQYTDGDIVVSNGIAYMCVRPTQNPPALWPMAPGTSAYGTTLPASPYDGQEAVLVDSVTNPTYQWRFRYNAGSSSTYKWEFIGGTQVDIVVSSDETTVTVGTWIDLTTVGPVFTASRAGIYRCVGNVDTYHSVAPAGSNFAVALAGAPAPSLIPSGISLALPNFGVTGLTVTGFVTLTAGATARLIYASSTAGTCHWRNRVLSVQPVRVS